MGHRRRCRNHSSSSSIISSSSSISSIASLSSKMSSKTSSSSLSTIADLSPAARRLLHSVLPEGIPMGWSSGNNNNNGSISLSTRSRSVSSKSRSKTRSKSLSTTSTTNISARSGSALGSALRASYCGVSVNNGGGIMDGLKGGIITTTNKSTPKKQRQRSVDSTTAKCQCILFFITWRHVRNIYITMK